MTECKQETLRFQEISGKQIEDKFDGGWSNDPQEALQEARDIWETQGTASRIIGTLLLSHTACKRFLSNVFMG